MGVEEVVHDDDEDCVEEDREEGGHKEKVCDDVGGEEDH